MWKLAAHPPLRLAARHFVSRIEGKSKPDGVCVWSAQIVRQRNENRHLIVVRTVVAFHSVSLRVSWDITLSCTIPSSWHGVYMVIINFILIKIANDCLIIDYWLLLLLLLLALPLLLTPPVTTDHWWSLVTSLTTVHCIYTHIRYFIWSQKLGTGTYKSDWLASHAEPRLVHGPSVRRPSLSPAD